MGQVWMVWMAWFGCSTHVPAGSTVDTVVRYQVEISGDFGAITVEEPGVPLQPASTVSLSLLLRLEPSRQFRDGSYARLVYVDGAKLTQDSEEKSLDMSLELQGRTVELRTFPDGEILDVSWGEKVAGQGRYLDVFEVVFPAISPSAPTISEGQTVQRRIIWPFRDANELRWDNIVDAVWQNHGRSAEGETDSWDLSYSGAWGTEGRTRRSEPKQTFRANGQAEGTLSFERRSAELLEHQFMWHREVVVEGATGVVTQQQRFSGRVERIR